MSQDVQHVHVRDSVLQGYLHNVQTTETFLIDPYKEWSNAIPDAYLGGMAHRMLSKSYESVRTCCRGVITVVLVVFCWFISLLNVQGTVKIKFMHHHDHPFHQVPWQLVCLSRALVPLQSRFRLFIVIITRILYFEMKELLPAMGKLCRNICCNRF